MRWIAALLVALVVTTSSVAGEKVYYVTCRIWNGIPRLGPIHHACVLICDERDAPFVLDGKGRKVSNPSCTYYGSRPHAPGFKPEDLIIDLVVKEVNISPDLVKDRIMSYDGRWTIIRNCQVAASWAVSAPSKRTIWSFILGQ